MNAHTAKIFKNLRRPRLDSTEENEQEILKKINDKCDTKQKNGPGTSSVSFIPNNEGMLCPMVSENQLEAHSSVEISATSSRGPTFDSELASNKGNLFDSSSDNYNPEEESTSSTSSCSTCSSSSGTSESEEQNGNTENKLSECPKRKKKNINAWKKNIRKQKRLTGESYVCSRNKERPARPMLPSPCSGKANHKCDTFVNEETDSKYKDLQKMCNDLTIPKNYHNFYNSINADKNIRDNLPDPNESEDSDEN